MDIRAILGSDVFWSTLAAFVAGLALFWIGQIVDRSKQSRKTKKKAKNIIELIKQEMRYNLDLMVKVAQTPGLVPYFKLRSNTKDAVWSEIVDLKQKKDLNVLKQIDKRYSVYSLISRQLDILYFAQGYNIQAPIYRDSILPSIVAEIPKTYLLLKSMGECELPIIDFYQETAKLDELPDHPYIDLCSTKSAAIDDLNDYEYCLRCFVQCFTYLVKKKLRIPNHAFDLRKPRIPEDVSVPDFQERKLAQLWPDGAIHFDLVIGVSPKKTGEPPLHANVFDIAVKKETGKFVVILLEKKAIFEIDLTNMDDVNQLITWMYTAITKRYTENIGSILNPDPDRKSLGTFKLTP